jgi:HK97 family phage prohead protease
MNRAYTILDIKKVDDAERVIEGIASTPTPDRMGDVVEPMGAQFKVPLPLLWQHDSRAPVGRVEFAKPNKNGIPFKAVIEQTDEPGTLKDRLDEAWQSVKLKLVRAVSIGFTINAYEILKDGGWRINEWEWLELSLVTIPANAEATIDRIKSIDAAVLAATGHKNNGSERTVSAGASAIRSTRVVKAQEARTMSRKSYAEQISAFEATRQAKSAEMDEIMDAAGEKGETLDAAQKEKYDTLSAEVKEIDDHLKRLREREKAEKDAAVSVRGGSQQDASDSRGGGDRPRVHVMSPKLDKGIGFTRCWAARYLAKHDDAYIGMRPDEIARKRGWGEEVEMVLKTAVTPARRPTRHGRRRSLFSRT